MKERNEEDRQEGRRWKKKDEGKRILMEEKVKDRRGG